MLEPIGNLVLYISAFVLVLSVVVFVHEFGHFQVAKWVGIRADTFSIGFGKSLLAWRDRDGVQWKIGALPLGGYVKFIDDADAASTGPRAELSPEERAEARAKGMFHAAPVWARSASVAAGPLANFVFSSLVFAAFFLAVGRDATDVGQLTARIDQIQAGSAAAQAGLQPGDVVVAIDGEGVNSFGDLQAVVHQSPGEELRLTILRDGARQDLMITPTEAKTIDATGAEVTRGLLGIGRTTLPEERVIERLGPIESLAAGAGQVWTIISHTVAYIGNIFSGAASAEHLAGPLGIADQSGKVLKGSWAVGGEDASVLDRAGSTALALLQWAAILSVAVGFVNLLPIPVLDGGHLAFYAAEAVRGRPLSAKAQEFGFKAGLAIVASLFLFATWNDLERLNVVEFLRGMLS